MAGFSSIRDQWSRRFQASIKFIFDTNNTGNLLMTDFFLSPFSRFVVNLGVDIIGSDNPSPVDFLSRYQRNDRLRIGLAYSF